MKNRNWEKTIIRTLIVVFLSLSVVLITLYASGQKEIVLMGREKLLRFILSLMLLLGPIYYAGTIYFKRRGGPSSFVFMEVVGIVLTFFPLTLKINNGYFDEEWWGHFQNMSFSEQGGVVFIMSLIVPPVLWTIGYFGYKNWEVLKKQDDIIKAMNEIRRPGNTQNPQEEKKSEPVSMNVEFKILIFSYFLFILLFMGDLLVKELMGAFH